MRNVVALALLAVTAAAVIACNSEGWLSRWWHGEDRESPENVSSLVHITSDECACIFEPLERFAGAQFASLDLHSGEVVPLEHAGAFGVAERGPVAFSPDARKAAFALLQDEPPHEPPYPVVVASAPGRKRTVCQVREFPVVLALSFSPDGQRLAMLGSAGVRVVALSDSGQHTLVDFERDFGNGISTVPVQVNSVHFDTPGLQSWTPDGKRIFFLAGKWFENPEKPYDRPRYVLHSVDVVSGDIAKHKIANAAVLAFIDEETIVAQVPFRIRYSPEWLSAELAVVDLTNGASRSFFQVEKDSLEYLLPWYYLGADGKFAYTYEGDVYVYDVKTGKVSQLTSDGRNGAAVYLPGRRRILFAARRMVYMMIGDKPSYVYDEIRLMKPDGSDSSVIYTP